MSEMTFTILDANRAIHSRQHGGLLEPLVAALSAEPETIEELAAAMARFAGPGEFRLTEGWHRGMCCEPYDAGIAIVDMASRLVAVQSTYCDPGPTGQVLYRDADRDIETSLPYHVSDDWRFVGNIETWESLTESRRHERQSAPQVDARNVLYGQVAEFVAAQCLAARRPVSPEAKGTASPSGLASVSANDDSPPGGEWTPPTGWSLEMLPERFGAGRTISSDDAVAEIHARWLMTPRDDLGGRTPRDVLVEKRDHLAWDLQDRGVQWSLLGACPPALSQTSAAFRCGGFGTHENVLYYELVRNLVWSCWQRVVEPAAEMAASTESSAEVEAWLRQVQDAWLSEPDWDHLGGRTPAEVIRCERERIPMICTRGEAIIDEDCPLCQMAADGQQPMFWHLDGCNMDDDFPFSLNCRTRQEWEEEQREREEFSRKFNEEWKCRQDILEADLPGSERTGGESIWKRSYSAPGVSDQRPWIRLFGIGCRVAELVVDLKSSPETAVLAKSLGRHFGNLRSAVADPSAALVEPVTERFCQELQEAADARPDLAAKCADLDTELREFADTVNRDDAPF